MPEPKIIEIDEITTDGSGDNGGGGTFNSRRHSRQAGGKPPTNAQSQTGGSDPLFSSIASSLGWKAMLTLKLTQWFLLLKSKRYGMWIIIPVAILLTLLMIPLGLLFLVAFFIKKVFFSSAR